MDSGLRTCAARRLLGLSWRYFVTLPSGSRRAGLASSAIGGWGCRPMLAVRIIPVSDVKDGARRQGRHLEGLRDAGDPVEAAKRSMTRRRRRDPLPRHHRRHEGKGHAARHRRRTADACFMPLTVGGGVSGGGGHPTSSSPGPTRSDQHRPVKRRAFVGEAARKFGSQCIVVAIDAK